MSKHTEKPEEAKAYFEQLKKRIYAAGYPNITAFCKATDINRPTLYNYKKQNHIPGRRMMNRIERGLGSASDFASNMLIPNEGIVVNKPPRDLYGIKQKCKICKSCVHRFMKPVAMPCKICHVLIPAMPTSQFIDGDDTDSNSKPVNGEYFEEAEEIAHAAFSSCEASAGNDGVETVVNNVISLLEYYRNHLKKGAVK